MEQINKQLGAKLDIFEQNGSDPESKSLMEGIIIAILIILGCGGLFTYCTIMSPKEPSFSFSGITTNKPATKPEKKQKEEKWAKGVQKEQLIVEGHQEAGEKIKISIENFDPRARYIIDFGDTHSRAITSNSISHIYRESGDYRLVMKISYDNEPIQRISKEIYIDEPIEVDSDAYDEK